MSKRLEGFVLSLKSVGTASPFLIIYPPARPSLVRCPVFVKTLQCDQLKGSR